jgi:hypothetical protein
LNGTAGRLAGRLTLAPSFRFALGRLLLHYVRTLMNRVRWEENREIRSLETRGGNLPRSTEQANKLFIATEQSLSLSEEARLQRIDQVCSPPRRFWAHARTSSQSSPTRRGSTQTTSWIWRNSRGSIQRRTGRLSPGSIPSPTLRLNTKIEGNTTLFYPNCVIDRSHRHIPAPLSS